MRIKQKGQIQIRARMSTVLAKGQFYCRIRGQEQKHIRIWIEDRSTGLLAGDWFILKQWGIRLLFEGCVGGSNGDNQAGRFLSPGLAEWRST